MKKYLGSLLLVLWNFQCISCADHNVNITEVPYQVFVRILLDNNTMYPICGGSIVSTRFILTASNCLDPPPNGRIIVVLGSNKLSSGGIQREAKRIIQHEDFNEIYLTNNIGLIEIDEIEPNAAIQPISLSREYVDGDVNVTVSGWGYIDTRKHATDILQALSLRTSSRKRCFKAASNRAISKYLDEKDTVMCVIPKTDDETCRGDIGGPVMRGRKLVGVVSFGYCYKLIPTGYTRVSSYVDWIMEKIN